jgi:TfoX-like protein
VAYDTDLAKRVRAALHRATARTALPQEIKMFGGLCFTVDGHMCCGVIGHDLVVRVGPTRFLAALAEPHARPMDFTGRPLKGFVYVGPAGCRRPADLANWIRRSLAFAGSLPPKKKYQ